METLDSIKTGELIRTHRKAQHLTQFELAEIADIDEKQLGKIERGVHYPSVPTFLKIIKALNIDVNVFYSENSKKIKTEESKLMKLIRKSSPKELDTVCKIIEIIQDEK